MKQFTKYILILFIIMSCSVNADNTSNNPQTFATHSAITITDPVETTIIAYPLAHSDDIYPVPADTPVATVSIDAMFTSVSPPTYVGTVEILQPTITFTPEIYQRIPTTSTQLVQELPRSAVSLLEASSWYTERIEKDVIFNIIPVQYIAGQSDVALVVFWIKVGTDKLGQQTMEFSPIVASVLISDGTSYEEQWNTEQWSISKGLESPLYTSRKQTAWYEQRFVAEDITGDNQPEIIMSGCGGFGNQCFYSLGIWSLDGVQLFSTESTPENIGATLSTRNNEPITREGVDFYRYNSVEMRPKRIILTFYAWNGSEFAKSKTEIRDFVDWDNPLVGNM